MRYLVGGAIVAAGLAAMAASSAALAAALIYETVPGHETAAGPPYPSDTADFRVGSAMHPPSAMSPIVTFRLASAQADAPQADPPNPLVPAALDGMLILPTAAGGGFRTAARVGVGLQFGPAPGNPLLIVPCVDVLMPDALSFGLLLPAQPVLAADGRSFDVAFSALLGDGSVLIQRLAFAIGAGQDLVFDAPTAVIGNSIDMAFLLLETGGRFDANSAAFTVTISGDLQIDEPAGLLLAVVGLMALAGLRRRRA